ncbi:hypothetical protein K144316041_p21150 (plasmid) [Clostridium tetani]|uniref:hypothetical protein n=1 Tax=Clostridium tetani TaxID=1513 RepID=UPI0029553786|nr:hypothetical protein [Clostridium tetani]BDR74276.1 hypothetical protein K144316041_p21150 [Clostridium tetani]
MVHKTTKELFNKNIGEIISVSLISETELREEIRMKGKLKEVRCNCFFIENEDGFIEMFRYEDLKYLKVLSNN